MEFNLDLLEQMDDLYEVKSRHLRYLNALLHDGWQAAIPGGYSNAWEQREWKFVLKRMEPVPRPLELLVPAKKRFAAWTMIGFTNEIIMEVSPDSLGDFLENYIGNPAARRNLSELFLGMDTVGPGMKAFGSLVVCAREENRFLDRFLPVLRAFAENDPREFGVDGELKDAADDFFREIEDFRRYLESDIFIQKKFSKDLKRMFRDALSVGILGYGEVSRVMSLARESGRGPSASFTAYKKMPVFPDAVSVEAFAELFDRYHELLGSAGLNPPGHGIRQISREDGTVTVFVTQSKLPPESLASSAVARATAGELPGLLRLMLGEVRKVALFNASDTGVSIGIDVRISNWGIEGFGGAGARVAGAETLYYLDTSTPMIREGDRELLDQAFLPSSAPFYIRGRDRTRYIRETIDRYYDPRALVIDLLADFMAVGRQGEVPALVEEANLFMSEEMGDLGLEPVAEKEVRKAYRRSRRAREDVAAAGRDGD